MHLQERRVALQEAKDRPALFVEVTNFLIPLGTEPVCRCPLLPNGVEKPTFRNVAEDMVANFRSINDFLLNENFIDSLGGSNRCAETLHCQ